jgi:hypothetical protein
MHMKIRPAKRAAPHRVPWLAKDGPDGEKPSEWVDKFRFRSVARRAYDGAPFRPGPDIEVSCA